jgi:hypothetical protein
MQSEGNAIYPKGIFPSQRYHPYLPYSREDDNLFFTASIVHILQGVQALMSVSEVELTREINANALSSYCLFKNKDGLDTFNFWQTSPSRHFPNGKFMHRFKHFQIPDDVDDTALVFLTEHADKERVGRLREKLKQHSNKAYKKAYNPLPAHRDLKCYSTFFGKNMYIEFDICVLSNLMRVILRHFKDELNEFDHHTLKFITEAILNNEHNSHPFQTAPNYPTTELILYHVSRLIPLLPNNDRTLISERIENDLLQKLISAQGMNKAILESAMLKLTGKLPEQIDRGMLLESGGFMSYPTMVPYDLINDKKFFFFHAGMITAFENRLAQSVADRSFFHIRYTSKALNGALLLENMLLKRIIQA